MKGLPGNLPLKAYHAICSRKVREIGESHKTCLFGDDRCPSAINSHSVAVAALNQIAEQGHVYTFLDPTYNELERIYITGHYQPVRRGINEASTFRGFCAYHDNNLFHEVESFPIKPTGRQVCLLHFRAFSRVFYSNINAGPALQAIASAKRPDGHNPVEALSLLASYEQSQRASFLDQKKDYINLLSGVQSNKQIALSYHFLRLGCVPDFMCSTLFVPIFDIDARFLLTTASEAELQRCQVASITISADAQGGFLLLVWNDGEAVTDAFAKTFVDSRYDISRLIAAIVGSADNFFFKESWWRNLDSEWQKFLMFCASVTFLDRNGDHLQQMYRAISRRRRACIDWPIISAQHGDVLDSGWAGK